MGKIKYIMFASLLAMAFTACEDNDDYVVPQLKLGNGDTSLTEVSINMLSERNIILSGGNGKYKANVEDSRIASATIVGDTLRLRGVNMGKTFLNVISHNQQQQLHVTVESALPLFSKDVIRIYPDRKEVRKFVSLTGGDEYTKLVVDDPDDILEVKWDGREDMLEIKAFYEGDAYIRAVNPDGNEASMKVEVRVEDEPQAVGIYNTSGRFVSNNVAVKGVLVVQRSGMATWISNTANPYVGNVNYDGVSLQIDPIRHPIEGEYMDINIKRFAGRSTIPVGLHHVLVEKIRGNLVQLRSNRHKFLLPFEK